MHGRQHPRSFLPSLFLHIEELQLPGTLIKLARTTIAGPNVTILVVLDLERKGGCKDLLWVFDWSNGWSKLVCPPLWYPAECEFLNFSQRLERLGIRNVAFIGESHLFTISLDPQNKRSYCLGVHDLRQRFPHVLFELPPHSCPTYFNPGVFRYSCSGPVSEFHGSPTNAILTIVVHEKIIMGATLVVVHPQSLYGLMEQGDSYIRWEQWKDRAELFKLRTLWGEPGNELQMTAGLRLITPASRGHSHREDPKLWLHTFQPWIPPRSVSAITPICDYSRGDNFRGNAKCAGMRFRTEDLSFHVQGSSPVLLPLISEEHILWIDVRRSLCLQPISTNLLL